MPPNTMPMRAVLPIHRLYTAAFPFVRRLLRLTCGQPHLRQYNLFYDVMASDRLQLHGETRGHALISSSHPVAAGLTHDDLPTRHVTGADPTANNKAGEAKGYARCTPRLVGYIVRRSQRVPTSMFDSSINCH